MYKIMVAIITTFIGIYSSQCLAAATGCVVLDGKTYTLNLSSIAIDPDAEVGATLYSSPRYRRSKDNLSFKLRKR
jgi:hypothetical protein